MDPDGLVEGAGADPARVPHDVIIEELLLSDGAERPLIERALAGIAKARATLGVDVPGLQGALLRPAAASGQSTQASSSPSPHHLARGGISAPLLTRADAVRYLTGRGLFAAERDWAFGETVVVGANLADTDLGIRVYERMMCIVPDGLQWTCFELDYPRPEDRDQLTLEDACARVAAILSRPRVDAGGG